MVFSSFFFFSFFLGILQQMELFCTITIMKLPSCCLTNIAVPHFYMYSESDLFLRKLTKEINTKILVIAHSTNFRKCTEQAEGQALLKQMLNTILMRLNLCSNAAFTSGTDTKQQLTVCPNIQAFLSSLKNENLNYSRRLVAKIVHWLVSKISTPFFNFLPVEKLMKQMRTNCSDALKQEKNAVKVFSKLKATGEE